MRTLALAVLLATLTACSTTPTEPGPAPTAAKQQKGPAVDALRLYVIDCGTLTVTDPSRFDFKKEELKALDFSVGCYLVMHPKGTLIWDTGAVPDANFTGDGKPATKFYGTVAKSLTSQLASAGVTPDQVDYLALSHYHWDHVGNASLFAKSTWLTIPLERATLFGPLLPERTSPEQVNPLQDTPVIEIQANQDYDVFGDGTVVIKPAYGHTPGSTVLYVKLAETGPIVLSGDLYHYPEEVTTKRLPYFEYNKDATRDSREKLDAFLKQTGATLWIQHDLLHFQTLKKAPEFYQ